MANSADLDIRRFLPHSQTPQHFNEVHAASVQSDVVKDTKGKEVATPVKEDKPSQYGPFHSSGEIIDRHRNASSNANVEVWDLRVVS